VSNANEPAYPTKRVERVRIGETEGGYAIEAVHHGLTKREYFAALAMQGLLADPEIVGKPEQYAKDAVTFADALLAELEKLR